MDDGSSQRAIGGVTHECVTGTSYTSTSIRRPSRTWRRRRSASNGGDERKGVNQPTPHGLSTGE